MIAPGVETTRETLACLVIDDPLLRPRYGCLDYEKLLQEMKVHNFFTEIAFIPWNYRRSNAKTVRLFAENPNHFGICVHGCNHLGNEFGGGNYQHLSRLSSQALWRMDEHRKLTGLPYDPVMVFPQGHFSSAAMRALKDQRFLAAFNTTIRATDADQPPVIEYQRPATTIYHDFPLFLRRYGKIKSVLLQDLASGRPIIIVGHHGAFKNGYKPMTDLVDWVNGLGKIKWTSLLNIVNHYCGGKTPPTLFPKETSATVSSVWNETRVALRRFASEAWDNYVEPSRFLTKPISCIKNAVKID